MQQAFGASASCRLDHRLAAQEANELLLHRSQPGAARMTGSGVETTVGVSFPWRPRFKLL